MLDPIWTFVGENPLVASVIVAALVLCFAYAKAMAYTKAMASAEKVEEERKLMARAEGQAQSPFEVAIRWEVDGTPKERVTTLQEDEDAKLHLLGAGPH